MSPRWAVAIIVLLHALFAVQSWRAVRTKSPTFDEPFHTMAGWMIRHRGDFRGDPEHPPLWEYWAALPHSRTALNVDWTAVRAEPDRPVDPMAIPHPIDVLFRTAGNDGDAMVGRSRRMMLIIGVALGAVIACWSWQWAGPRAAVVASILFAFDPNFLAHAPLVKNDIAFSFSTLALAWSLWLLGRRVTWARAGVASILTGVGFMIKFSGILYAALVPFVLFLRALSPWDWSVLGRELRNRSARMCVAVFLCLLIMAMTILITWASYQFRFLPTPDPHLSYNVEEIIFFAAASQAAAERPGRTPEMVDIRLKRSGFLFRFASAAEKHHLLPHAFLSSILRSLGSSQTRPAFLCGEYRTTGWWYYFPFAMLVKTPLATMAVALMLLWAARHPSTGSLPRLDPWTKFCLLAPVAGYGFAAVTSNLNLGIRHVLPLYPFLYVGMGVGASMVWDRPALRRILPALLVALAVESALAFPDYLSFFNRAAGGSRGGLRLLGDSNIDWGQDLKELAEWQKRHPDTKLYLCYFGSADPSFYGVRYVPLPGGYARTAPVQIPWEPGVAAISATNLQGISFDPQVRMFYEPLRRARPLEILGGSIYLYDAKLLTAHETGR
ncbi:MAG: hypothetical protein A3I06_10950 [Candidatus Lindowbacteria bacterium RIFCSPLOWO2_02_FULL_62_12]|nr:MAG: hypothetical protein A3I06_10950 [Candidatus Lindowbacteria bacterium RIFCSPLOWO2_02_FULL_62_12]